MPPRRRLFGRPAHKPIGPAAPAPAGQPPRRKVIRISQPRPAVLPPAGPGVKRRPMGRKDYRRRMYKAKLKQQRG